MPKPEVDLSTARPILGVPGFGSNNVRIETKSEHASRNSLRRSVSIFSAENFSRPSSSR